MNMTCYSLFVICCSCIYILSTFIFYMKNTPFCQFLSSDAMLIVDKKSITCKINTSGTNFYLQLQHSYGGNIIRQIKALARCAVSLPFLSVPYYNNGQYRCLIKDTRGMVSLNETVTTYVFSG